MLREQVDRALDAAEKRRLRVNEVQGEGAAVRGAWPQVQALLRRGAVEAEGARVARAKDAFDDALAAARRAEGLNAEGLDLALSARAKDDARAAGEECERQGASRYAAAEVARAKNLEAEGDGLASRREHATAREKYEEAARAYREAQGALEEKGAAAQAREGAERARETAERELPKEHRPRTFLDGDETLARARELERSGRYPAARDHYARATRLFEQASLLGPALRDAVALRRMAHARQDEAQADLAAEFAPDELEKARLALAEADRALERDDGAGAGERYRLAEYRFRLALERSSPHAKWKRRLEVLRRQVEQARRLAKGAEDVKTSTFEAALRAFLEGDEEFAERHWRTAERLYEKALRLFEAAAAAQPK
jgi:hypothetical protein